MKKIVIKKLIACAGGAVLLINAPLMAYAANYDISVGNVTVNATSTGQTITQENNSEAQGVADDSPVIYGETDQNKVVINADADCTANVTFQNLTIELPESSRTAAVETEGSGNVIIELNGTDSLMSGSGQAGLQKSNNGTLTIQDNVAYNNENQASLRAEGGAFSAGIGGSENQAGNNITITGGNITAIGNLSGAGIGGGGSGAGSSIIINGNATVTATSTNSGAGIGGGDGGSGSNITISGNARVTAKSRNNGAGIGGGWNGAGSGIYISGNATVTASSDNQGAGIGGGWEKDGSNINISGNANVTASGRLHGAGIGGGGEGEGNGITISDNATVIARGGELAAGIGGGEEKSGKNIIISGGNITATGGDQAAGIGGGYEGSGDVITIGGNARVIATGGEMAAGIGGGYDRNGTNITIEGNSIVVAVSAGSRNGSGAGIGSGFCGSIATVQVKDSANVHAVGGRNGNGYHAPGIGIGQASPLDDGTEIDPVQPGFTGSIANYPAGTPLNSVVAIAFPNPVAVNTGGSMETGNTDTPSDNTGDRYGITPKMLIDSINILSKLSNSDSITIDFGRNICLTPALTKVLFETGNVSKKCTFIHEGKRYTLYIPVVNTNSKDFVNAMEILKKENNRTGQAGFKRVHQIFAKTGVKLTEEA